MWRLTSVLFPDPPRELKGRRGLKIALRAVHVLCASILFGGYVFKAGIESLGPWILATLGSGLLILLLDLHETAAFLLQTRGLWVVTKLLLLGTLPWLGDLQVWILGGIVVVSVVSSHAPSKWRYFLVFGGGRVTGPVSKG